MPVKRGDNSPLPRGVTGSFLTADFPKLIQEAISKIENRSLPPKRLNVFSQVRNIAIESQYNRIFNNFEKISNTILQFLQTSEKQIATLEFLAKMNIFRKVKELEQLEVLRLIILDINELLTVETIPDIEILQRYFDLIEDTLRLFSSEEFKIAAIDENTKDLQGFVLMLKKPDPIQDFTENSYIGTEYDLASIPPSVHENKEHPNTDTNTGTEASFKDLFEEPLAEDLPVAEKTPREPKREALPVTQTGDFDTDSFRKALAERTATEPRRIEKIIQTEKPPTKIEAPEFPYTMQFDNEKHQLSFIENKDTGPKNHNIPLPPHLHGQIISETAELIVFDISDSTQPEKTYHFKFFSKPHNVLRDKRPPKTIWLTIQHPDGYIEERTYKRNTASDLKVIFENLTHVEEPFKPFLNLHEKTLTFNNHEGTETKIQIPTEFTVQILKQDFSSFLFEIKKISEDISFLIDYQITKEKQAKITLFVYRNETLIGETASSESFENIIKTLFKKESRETLIARRFDKEEEAQRKDQAVYDERKALQSSNNELFTTSKEIRKKALATRAEKAKKFPLPKDPTVFQFSQKNKIQRLEAVLKQGPITDFAANEKPLDLPHLPPKLRKERHDAFQKNLEALQPPRLSQEDTLPQISKENTEISEFSTPPRVTYDKSSNTLSILDKSGYKKTFTFKVPVAFTKENDSNFSLDFTFEDDALNAALESENGTFIITFYNTSGQVIQSLKEQDLSAIQKADKTPYSKNTQTMIQMIERIEIEKNKIVAKRREHSNKERQTRRDEQMKADIESRRLPKIPKPQIPRVYHPEDILSKEEIDDLHTLLSQRDNKFTSPEQRETPRPAFAQGALFARAKREEEGRMHTFSSTEQLDSNITEAGDDAILANPQLNLYAVFDGVSSSSEGSKAAQACAFFLEQEVKKLLSESPHPKTIAIRFKHIFSEMPEYLESEHISGSTTGTATLVYNGVVHTASVGDSCAFLYRPFNDEGNQIVELMQEDNKISELFKEYPYIITKINSILNNYDGDVSTLKQIELPIPDNFKHLEKIQAILEKQRAKTPTPVLERQIAGVTTLLQIFNEYQEQGFIPAEKSPEVMVSLFALRSFITDAIRPIGPNDVGQFNVQITSTALNPFDRLVLRTDAFDVLTEKQITHALETSESPEEFLQNQETLLDTNTKPQNIRSKRDDASCIYVETNDTKTSFEYFQIFEKYIEEIQQDIGAFEEKEFPEFFALSRKYTEAKDAQDFMMAKKYLLEMIHFTETYAEGCGSTLPAYPIHRESKTEIVDLMEIIKPINFDTLSQNDKNFVSSIIRYYTWGAPKKISALVDAIYPFKNTILRENIKNIFEAIQPFIQNAEIQQLLDNQNLLIQKDEDRYYTHLQETRLDKEEIQRENEGKIEEHETEQIAEEIQKINQEHEEQERTKQIAEIMQQEQNRYAGVIQGEPLGHTSTQTYAPLKTQVPTRSWFRSTKARIAGALLAFGQLINSTYTDNNEKPKLDPTTIASLEKEPEVRRQPNETSQRGIQGTQTSALDAGLLVKIPNSGPSAGKSQNTIEIANRKTQISIPEIPSTSSVAREADMQKAPAISSDSQTSTLDAGLSVKIPKDAGTSIANKTTSEKLSAVNQDRENLLKTTVDGGTKAAPQEALAKVTISHTDDTRLNAARDALAKATSQADIETEKPQLATNTTIGRGEGVTQAVLRALKASGVKTEIANLAVVKIANQYAKEGRTLPRAVTLGDTWNYSYDEKTQTITQISAGHAKVEATLSQPTMRPTTTEIAKAPPEAKASPEIQSFENAHVEQFIKGQKILYLTNAGKYESYTIETDGVAPGSVALVKEKINANGKKVKSQFAMREQDLKERSLDPNKITLYEKIKIAVQKIDTFTDRIILTGTDGGGIIVAVFHYLVDHLGFKPTEAFQMANDIEIQRNIPAEGQAITYTKAPNNVRVGDSIIIKHVKDSSAKNKISIKAIHKRYPKQTELPKKLERIEIEDPFAP